jgi:alkanesulfonate monooxygenase SsuD/methylene tetrahydromethanopterin reductase-like flavin-dependent oxidoreductase (luciferase family)
MDVWMHTFSFAGRVAAVARQVEQWGFTGLLVADSQNLNADIWIELALAGPPRSVSCSGQGSPTRSPAIPP